MGIQGFPKRLLEGSNKVVHGATTRAMHGLQPDCAEPVAGADGLDRGIEDCILIALPGLEEARYVYVSIHQSIHLSIYSLIYPSIHASIHLSMCVPTYLCIYL